MSGFLKGDEELIASDRLYPPNTENLPFSNQFLLYYVKRIFLLEI